MPVSSSPAVTVSVVVPVFNEIATVREALDALVAKRIPGYELNLIIVESNSTDGSREIVLGYRGLPGVTLILEDSPEGQGPRRPGRPRGGHRRDHHDPGRGPRV